MGGRPRRTAAMRLLLDEMLSPAIARALRDRGHDVEAVAEDAGLRGGPDAEVFAAALERRRAVVTNNVADFRRLHHEAVRPGGTGHLGLVLLAGGFRRSRADVARIADALEGVLRERPEDRGLADAERWLAPTGEPGS
jgi:hypothetical protein